MFGWFYKLFAANRFKSQARLSFGLIRAFKENILARIEEIIETTQSNYIKVADHFNKYNVLNNSLEECYYSKDEFDYVTKYSDPIIAPAQESRLRFLNKMLWFSITVFFVVETFLFFMISENITGGIARLISDMGPNATKYGVPVFLFIASAFFALLCALIFDLGLKLVLYFLLAQKHYNDKFINSGKFNWAIVKLIFGIALIIGSFLTLFYLNKARSFAIDSAAAKGASHNPMLVTGLIVLSVVAGIAFGISKILLAENSELLGLADKWNKIRKEMANTHSAMTELSIRISNQYSLAINKSLSLGIDLQEIMEREYDERDAELLMEFRNEFKNGKFHINNANGKIITVITPQDAYYYNNLTTNEMLLHNNHFTSHERIAEIMHDVNRMLFTVNNMEQKRLNKLTTTNPINANKRIDTTLNYEPKTENENIIPELSITNSETVLNSNSGSKDSLNATLIYKN